MPPPPCPPHTHLHPGHRGLGENGQEGGEDGYLIKEGSHLELDGNAIQHLHHSVVDGVGVGTVVCQDQAVGPDYLVVAKSEEREKKRGKER